MIESVKPGRDGLDVGDQPVGVGGQLVAVRLVGPLVRHPLGEHAHHVLALGRQRRVEHAGDADVGERVRRRPARRRRPGTRRSTASSDGAMTIVPPWTSGEKSGMAGERRQAVEREVDLHRARAGLPPLDPADEVVGQLGAVDQAEEADLRVHGGHDDRGVQDVAVGERDTGDLSAAHEDLATGLDVRSSAPKCRAAAASASDTPPIPPRGKPHAPTLAAVADVADLVVGHDVGGPRRAAGRPTCRSRRTR